MASASWVTTTRFAESVSVPSVAVAIFEIFNIEPVTLVVALAWLVMVVLPRSKMFPESVKVCRAVELVLEVESKPISPEKEPVAEEEVRVPDNNPPEVMALEVLAIPIPSPVDKAPVVKL
ncbi:MAG: hypothetical protein AAB922_00370, partial [Patescibacteria group bacterium]